MNICYHVEFTSIGGGKTPSEFVHKPCWLCPSPFPGHLSPAYILGRDKALKSNPSNVIVVWPKLRSTCFTFLSLHLLIGKMGEHLYLTDVKFQWENACRVMNSTLAYSKCSVSISSYYSGGEGHWEGEERVVRACWWAASSWLCLEKVVQQGNQASFTLGRRKPMKFFEFQHDEIKMCFKRPILKEEIWERKMGEKEWLGNINRLEITFSFFGRIESRFKSEVVMTLNDIYKLMTNKFISPIRTSHCHWIFSRHLRLICPKFLNLPFSTQPHTAPPVLFPSLFKAAPFFQLLKPRTLKASFLPFIPSCSPFSPEDILLALSPKHLDRTQLLLFLLPATTHLFVQATIITCLNHGPGLLT